MKIKKVLSCILAVIMLAGVFPAEAIISSATDAQTVTVNAGENGTVKWNGQSGSSLDVTVEDGQSLADAGVTVEPKDGYQLKDFSFDTKVVDVKTGCHNTVLVLSDGTVWSAGYNGKGAFGNGTNDNSTTFVQAKDSSGEFLTGAVQVTSGEYHTVVLKKDGTVWSAGFNKNGQLGDGTNDDKNIFVQAKDSNGEYLSNVVQISAGLGYTQALKKDGTVWATGNNNEGELGDGTNDDKNIFVRSNIENVIKISAGEYHSVALDKNGVVWSVGYNRFFQLGDGTQTNKTTFVKVDIDDVVKISAGNAHTVVLKKDGTIWSIGDNASGQLGDGTKDDKSTFVQSLNIDKVVEVSAQRADTVAIREDRTLWCTGSNYYGQLGDGTKEDKSTFVQSSNISNVAKVSEGNGYSVVVLKEDGTMWAVGRNQSGQFGNGTKKDETTYVKINSPAKTITKTALADIVPTGDMTVTANILKIHNVKVNAGENGTVKWNGQSGSSLDVTVEDGQSLADAGVTIEPKNGYRIDDYSFDAKVVQVVAGGGYTAVLLNDSAVWAIGGNALGQLGDGTKDDKSTFVRSKDSDGNYLTNVKQLVSGGYYTVALKNDGTVWATGNNIDGQLGDGTEINKSAFVQAKDANGDYLTGVKAVAAGSYHTVALKSDGTVWAVGNNKYGQLGDGTKDKKSTFVQAINITNVTAISAGKNHTVALKSDGTVWAVGDNYFGQLGDGTNNQKSTFVQSKNLTNVKAISVGNDHTVALKNDGTVWAVGSGDQGRLGNGTEDRKSTFVQSKDKNGNNLTGIKQISAGGTNTVALKNVGTIWATGYNYNGQLGDGTNVDKLKFVQSQDISDVSQISAGNYHTLALKNDGTVWAVGYNSNGQLGDGTKNDKSIFVKSNTPRITKTALADIIPTDDITVNANISQIMYKVTFKDTNGKVVSEKSYPEGTLSSDVEVPANTATYFNETSHTVYYWHQVNDVTEDVQYDEVLNTNSHSTTGSYTSNGDATCTADGTKYGYCDVCKQKFSVADKGSAFGHTPATAVKENEVAPTCSAKGSYDSVVYCSVCNAQLSRDTKEINALSHDYKSVVTKPTCTAKGYTTYTCSVCNDSYVADYVNALGHTPATAVNENEVAPTCTVKGSYDSVVYCSVCNAELSRDTKEINALGHNYKEVVTKPTCTEPGYTTYTCKNCNDTYVADNTNALGHDYKAVVTKPTCTAKGYTTHTCTHCKDSFVDTYVNAKGHSFKNGKCTVCGAKDPKYQVKQTITTSFTSKDLGISYIGYKYKLNAKAKTSLTYKSNNTKVATVDKNGIVTIKGSGTATITVTASATSKYAKATKTVKIKVSRKLLTYKTLYNVNYRTGAGLNYRVVNSVQKGKKVYVLEKSQKKGTNKRIWVQVKVNGRYYWMEQRLLKRA